MKIQSLPRPLLLSLLALVAILGLVACGATEEPAASEGDTEATATPADDAVEYEPAYPEEVSTEGLSTADTEQQGEHTPADGTTHDHGDGEDHDH